MPTSCLTASEVMTVYSRSPRSDSWGVRQDQRVAQRLLTTELMQKTGRFRSDQRARTLKAGNGPGELTNLGTSR